jgi:hypothetical protein
VRARPGDAGGARRGDRPRRRQRDMGYQALESSRSIDVVVLDKTGTVSRRVTNVRPDIPETAPARSPASADP